MVLQQHDRDRKITLKFKTLLPALRNDDGLEQHNCGNTESLAWRAQTKMLKIVR